MHQHKKYNTNDVVTSDLSQIIKNNPPLTEFEGDVSNNRPANANHVHGL